MSKEVRIFDAEKSEWKDEAPLPAEFGGGEGGLWFHRSVEYEDGNGRSVMCFGGYVDSNWTKLSDNIITFM